MDGPLGSSSILVPQCLGRAQHEGDRMIDRHMRRIAAATESRSRRAEQARVQRLWRAYRAATCELHDVPDGGQGRFIFHAVCMVVVTGHRLLDLRDQAEYFLGSPR